MTDHSITSIAPGTPIPADDLKRRLTVADPDGSQVRHVSVVGDTYTILVSGAQTDGRYCLIDMLVPDGGGPPPHRHDFEKCSRCLKVRSNSRFAARPRPCAKARP